MMAQNSYDIIRPVTGRSKSKRRTGFFNALFRNQIACILLVAVVVCLVANVYISAYAGVVEKGYEKADLTSHLKALRLQNERMRIKLDGLRQPDKISTFADKSKMKQSEEMAYLSPNYQPSVAQNTER
ncbi:MAG: hypothetical protein ACYC27_17085 [Armatimonadota bacterium]